MCVMATMRMRTKKDGSKSYHVVIRLKGYPPQAKTLRRLVILLLTYKYLFAGSIPKLLKKLFHQAKFPFS